MPTSFKTIKQTTKLRIIISLAWAIISYLVVILSEDFYEREFAIWLLWMCPVLAYWSCIWVWGKLPLPKLPEFGPVEEQPVSKNEPPKKKGAFHFCIFLAFFYAAQASEIFINFGLVGVIGTALLSYFTSGLLYRKTQLLKHGGEIRVLVIVISVLVIAVSLVIHAVHQDNKRLEKIKPQTSNEITNKFSNMIETTPGMREALRTGDFSQVEWNN